MGKQNKQLLDNIDNFNSNEFQGRSARQVRNNETIAAVSVLGLILTAVIAAIYNYIIA
tara:strand:- start:341 stop:514 length:174 start_codon:yes stop_codon:yes gene_type:complete